MIDLATAPPLCDPSQLTGFPGGADLPREVIDLASGVVRAACGWHIAPEITETMRLDTDGSNLITLPTLYVNQVIEIVDADGIAVTKWRWSAKGQIELIDTNARWPAGFGAVTVTLMHGLEVAPPAVLAVVASVGVQLSASAPPGVKAMTIGDESFTFDTGGAGQIIAQYDHILRRFRL